MSVSAIDLSFYDSMMWLNLSGGRKFGVPPTYFTRLLRATTEQWRQPRTLIRSLLCDFGCNADCA